jgi:xanthosine utilization system XapX-like protein
MATTNEVVREGVSAGLIGALAIAAWFAILDGAKGAFFSTPIMLGGALGSLFLNGAEPSPAAAFLGYTVFHFGLFCLVGIVFSWVVNSAERTPSALIGFLGLFVAFEVGWVGWTSVLARGFGTLTWLQVFIANLIGSIAMGLYMWRMHPGLSKRVDAVLAGAPE